MGSYRESSHLHQSDVADYLNVDLATAVFTPRWFTSPERVSIALERAALMYVCCVEQMHKRLNFGPKATEAIRDFCSVLRRNQLARSPIVPSAP
jgi:hypothetical protein